MKRLLFLLAALLIGLCAHSQVQQPKGDTLRFIDDIKLSQPADEVAKALKAWASRLDPARGFVIARQSENEIALRAELHSSVADVRGRRQSISATYTISMLLAGDVLQVIMGPYHPNDRGMEGIAITSARHPKYNGMGKYTINLMWDEYKTAAATEHDRIIEDLKTMIR